MLNSFEIKTLLDKLGFEHFKNNPRIDGYRHSNMSDPIYVKTTSDKKLKPATVAPLVVHAKYERIIRESIEENSNISFGNNFYFFNSNMSGFEKKLNGGKTPTPFGIHLNFADSGGLGKLIDLMSHSKVKCFNAESTVARIGIETNFDETVLQAIKTRRGQPAFRTAMLSEFNKTCCISGCKIEAVLEAAHIIPHGEETNYSVTNGLLLRADIHTLFDLNLIQISSLGIVEIDSSLKGSEYEQYDGLKFYNGVIPNELKNNLIKRNKAVG